MNGKATKTDGHREIVVTIDTSACAPPAIALAAALARARQQALHGLFLEDEDLLRVARLPFSQEFHRVGGRARAMSSPQLERAMARLAGEFRAALERQASQFAVSWSYSTMRGNRTHFAASPAAHNAELLVIAAPVEQTANRPEHILVLDWDLSTVPHKVIP